VFFTEKSVQNTDNNFVLKMKREKLNIITLTEVDSTNNYANRLISEGSAENGSVVVSYYQKSGRGQRGNSWESAPGKNLLASIIVFPQFLPAAQQFYLSKIIEGIIDELENVHGLSIDLDSPHHLMFVVDFSTWRYQNKGIMESMPRHLQYRLHKLIIASVKKNEKT